MFSVTVFFSKNSVTPFYIYVLFLTAVYTVTDFFTYGDTSYVYFLSYLIFAFACGLLVFRFIRIRYVSAYLVFLVNLVALLVPVFNLGYYAIYKVAVTTDVIHSVMQVNLRQAVEFVDGIRFFVHGIVAYIVVCILLTLLLWKYLSARQSDSHPPKRTWAQIVVSISCFSFAIFIGNPRMVSQIPTSVLIYQEELAKFKQELAKKIDITGFTATKKQWEETYIIAIGESLNREQMSIYGYLRNTTPHLAQERELLVFKNVFSTHSLTRFALPRSFTAANHYNGREYYESISLFDVLHKAGVETYWLTNHSLYSAWDNAVTVLARQANYLQGFNYHIGTTVKTHHFDEVLLPKVETILSTATTNSRVIFVHLYGNHREYCLRFPVRFQRFSGSLPVELYGNIAKSINYHEKINCYDNSVLYHDYVVSSLLQLVKQQSGVIGFLFFPDHGVDVWADLGQALGRLTYDMLNIPMLAWFSPEYRQRYATRYQTFSKNVERLFPNELLYDTLLGLMSVETDRYSSKFDLSSPDFSLAEDAALIIDGQRKYTSEQNKRWWQQKNIGKIISEQQALRIIPQRVNSVGKLKQVYYDDYRAFEVDLFYHETKDCLIVAHAELIDEGVCFIDFLAEITPKQLQKIYLDVEAQGGEVHKILGRLGKIENQLGLKQEFIIEYSAVAALSKFSYAGYHTSFSLPDSLSALLAQRNNESLARQAREIVSLVASTASQAITFDEKLWSFVENYLRVQLPDNVVYHLKFATDTERNKNYDLTNVKFLKNIKSKKYYTDSKIDTIMVHYESVFHL